MKRNYTISPQPNNVKLELAKRHKVLRKSLKISQADLAIRSGVSLGSIKRFEQTGEIAFTALLKLSNVLGRLTEFEGLFITSTDNNIEKLFSE